MENVDLIGLALKREGVEVFPPPKHGAYFTDNPQTEIWEIDSETAAEIQVAAQNGETTEAEVIKNAIRNRFRLPPQVGETDTLNLRQVQGGSWLLALDRDETFTQVIKAVADARADTNHLVVLNECLSTFLASEPEN